MINMRKRQIILAIGITALLIGSSACTSISLTKQIPITERTVFMNQTENGEMKINSYFPTEKLSTISQLIGFWDSHSYPPYYVGNFVIEEQASSMKYFMVLTDLSPDIIEEVSSFLTDPSSISFLKYPISYNELAATQNRFQKSKERILGNQLSQFIYSTGIKIHYRTTTTNNEIQELIIKLGIGVEESKLDEITKVLVSHFGDKIEVYATKIAVSE